MSPRRPESRGTIPWATTYTAYRDKENERVIPVNNTLVKNKARGCMLYNVQYLQTVAHVKFAVHLPFSDWQRESHVGFSTSQLGLGLYSRSRFKDSLLLMSWLHNWRCSRPEHSSAPSHKKVGSVICLRSQVQACSSNKSSQTNTPGNPSLASMGLRTHD